MCFLITVYSVGKLKHLYLSLSKWCPNNVVYPVIPNGYFHILILAHLMPQMLHLVSSTRAISRLYWPTSYQPLLLHTSDGYYTRIKAQYVS